MEGYKEEEDDKGKEEGEEEYDEGQKEVAKEDVDNNKSFEETLRNGHRSHLNKGAVENVGGIHLESEANNYRSQPMV